MSGLWSGRERGRPRPQPMSLFNSVGPDPFGAGFGLAQLRLQMASSFIDLNVRK